MFFLTFDNTYTLQQNSIIFSKFNCNLAIMNNHFFKKCHQLK